MLSIHIPYWDTLSVRCPGSPLGPKVSENIPSLKLRHLKSIVYLLNPFYEESLGGREDFCEDFFEGFLLKAPGDDLSLNRSLYHQLHLLTPQIQPLNCHLLSDWSDYSRPFLFSRWLIQGSSDSPMSGLRGTEDSFVTENGLKIPGLHQAAYHHEAFQAKPLLDQIEFLINDFRGLQCLYHIE